MTRKVAVLTGGPGCGKSFTARSVVALAKAKRARIVPAERAQPSGSLQVPCMKRSSLAPRLRRGASEI